MYYGRLSNKARLIIVILFSIFVTVMVFYSGIQSMKTENIKDSIPGLPDSLIHHEN